jgi:hypothetical protein
MESIAPYDSGRNIILDLEDNSVESEGRKTRKQIVHERAKKAIESKMSEDAALSKARSIIGEYDPDRQSYESDLAKLMEIDIASLGRNNYTHQANGLSINSVTKNPNTSDNPNTPTRESKTESESESESVTNNTSVTSDLLVTQWERKLAELMRSNESGDKSDEIAAITLRIERRKQFLARQAEMLIGADVFKIDSSVQLSQNYLDDGWCNLFDGKTLFGWRVQDNGFYGGGHFSVVNGEIHSDPKYPGLLYTTNQFGDSTISLEFCADENTELFLLYRTSPNPRDLHTSCYTIVLNSSDRKRSRGTILGRIKLDNEQSYLMNSKNNQNNSNEPEYEQNEVWHRVIIGCEGGALSCTIDRQLPTTLVDSSPIGRGYIGLLVTRGKTRFRNIMWRPRTSVLLFDGIDFDASWRYKRETVTVTTNRMTLQLRGGPGVIESLESFSDFMLQFEYRIANISGKAGLFFRANPRVEKSGYEISLQNFPTRKDRDDFFAIDAGSFVGRKSGRYVGAEDMQWNYFTLTAVDRQFQTWINGILVCEMTDKSKNPKMITVVNTKETVDGKEILDYMLPQKDEFHKNGTIQFYAPTDSSNIDIRNIRITKIAERSPKKQTIENDKKTTLKAKLKEEKRIENERKLDQKMRDNN